jgi:pyruvate kinase
VINPSRAGLIPVGSALPDEINVYIPVDKEWLQSLQVGDKIYFRDTRDKKRQLKVAETENEIVWVNAYDACYIKTGTLFQRNVDVETIAVGEILPKEQALILKPGDTLILHKDQRDGELAEYDEEGLLLKTAHISCTSEEIFDDVKVGDPIYFDDGKIEGIIRKNDGDNMHVEITYAKEEGTKLKADKGINLPESDLQISGLTNKDREDLVFVAAYADAVNMSFVNCKEDVEDLISELEKLDACNRLGIILKIETQKAFDNLPEILLSAMRVKPLGVMIARGDLAIECGWENVGRIQEEILWMCEAAHVPTVWATQVLENLAKKGLPSRAEITDAVMAQRADCVMLNKGPFITSAIAMLDRILIKMQEYQDKKAALLPALSSSPSVERIVNPEIVIEKSLDQVEEEKH